MERLTPHIKTPNYAVQIRTTQTLAADCMGNKEGHPKRDRQIQPQQSLNADAEQRVKQRNYRRRQTRATKIHHARRGGNPRIAIFLPSKNLLGEMTQSREGMREIGSWVPDSAHLILRFARGVLLKQVAAAARG
jgi:hypothetical protein